MRTRETVGDQGQELVHLLRFSSIKPAPRARRVLYSVGIDSSGATNLVQHSGPGFERETLLGSVAEEDLDVSLALDPIDAMFSMPRSVTTASRRGMAARLKEIALQNTAPRRLVARAGCFSLSTGTRR